MAQEKNFEDKVKKFFEELGIYAAGTPKQNMKLPILGWYFKVFGGGFQKAGIPDIVACVNGVFIAIELKAEKGKISLLQKKNISMINRAEGLGIILKPSGFEEFQTLIKEVIVKCNSHIAGLNALKNANTSSSCVILMNSG